MIVALFSYLFSVVEERPCNSKDWKIPTDMHGLRSCQPKGHKASWGPFIFILEYLNGDGVNLNALLGFRACCEGRETNFFFKYL